MCYDEAWRLDSMSSQRRHLDLTISMVIAVMLVVGLAIRVIQLTIDNHNLVEGYNSLKSQLDATRAQLNPPGCQYYLDFLHNGHPCPYNQSTGNSVPLN